MKISDDVMIIFFSVILIVASWFWQTEREYDIQIKAWQTYKEVLGHE